MTGLRVRVVGVVIGVYVVVGAVLGYMLTRPAVDPLVASYVKELAQQQRDAIFHRVERELVLGRKLADSPVLLDWIRHEQDPLRKQRALQELESYRRLFTDHSWFVAFEPHRNYYYNDAKNQFRGQELRHTLSPDDLSNHWYFATLANVTEYALHVDNSEKLGVTKLWFNVVVRDGSKKVGVAGSGMDLTGFLKSIVRPVRAGVTTIVVDRHGTIQGHPDESLMWVSADRLDESRLTPLFSLLAPADRPVVQGVLDRLQAGQPTVESFAVSYQGQPMLGAAAALPDLEWDVLVLAAPEQLAPSPPVGPVLGVWVAGLLVTVLLLGWSLKG